jgi:hypothetical protein
VFTTITFEAVGVAASPFSKVTVAPDTKPVPVMVTLIVVPACIEFGAMPVTVTPTGLDSGAKLAVLVKSSATVTSRAALAYPGAEAVSVIAGGDAGDR